LATLWAVGSTYPYFHPDVLLIFHLWRGTFVHYCFVPKLCLVQKIFCSKTF